MADTVFSAKVDETVKAKFEGMAQAAGTTQKEFFSRLVAAYEAAQVRESTDNVKEMEQLRYHLVRVEEIYLSLVMAARDQKEADADRVSRAEEEVKRAKASALDTKEQADKAVREAGEQVEAVRAEAALIREQSEKELREMREAMGRALESREQATKLASLAEEAAAAAKTKAVEMEALANQANTYRQETEDERKKTAELSRHLEKTEEALRKAQAEAKIALDAQVVRMEEALQRASERAELEKVKAVLAARSEAMGEIGRLREALAQAREEKAALEVQIARASYGHPLPGQL